MNESLQDQAFRELAGMECACGARKERSQSFCRECYFALPKETRTALYKREGYPNTWDDAKEWLQLNTGRFQRKAR